MEAENKQTIPAYKAEQYLMTAFSRAEWILPEYKKLSSACRDNPEAFRELYLCACDKVPIELVQMAISNEPMVENLKKVRSKHFEKKYTDMQNFFVNELTETVDALRKEIDTISGAAKFFADTIPNLEEMFASEPRSDIQGKKVADISLEDEVFTEKASVANGGEKTEIQEVKTNVNMPIRTNNSKWKEALIGIFEQKMKPADFLNELYAKGYKEEQIGFVISCIEEGLSEKQIRTFISPKFDIATMKRLRKLYVKE